MFEEMSAVSSEAPDMLQRMEHQMCDCSCAVLVGWLEKQTADTE